MKKHLDKGKYAAPRWLVYPELSAWTIGWRMGYGEDYIMNEPYHTPEFNELFPMPLNWLFDPYKSKITPIPLLGYLWSDDGKPKYSKITDDKVIVNDFLSMDDEKDFRHNHLTFKSIEHALLFIRYTLQSEHSIDRVKDIDELKDITLSDSQKETWEKIKYTVCLNASYYKIMQDEELKQKLLETGDTTLVYESDDEWGGEDNLFGFALMELRDEIRRLYKNQDLIDWEYTEYLKVKNPYENPKPRNPHDEQTAEYRIISSTFHSAGKYVRDVNLKSEIAEKYEPGQFITERAFVDASNKIGGMITTHRYLILSNLMADFSRFEEDTNWGLHVAKNGSTFKVVDVFTIDGKTQIVLLQLPEGFEEVFENRVRVEEEFIEMLRDEFRETLKLEPVSELTSEIWLERCSFPLGMDDDGEFF